MPRDDRKTLEELGALLVELDARAKLMSRQAMSNGERDTAIKVEKSLRRRTQRALELLGDYMGEPIAAASGRVMSSRAHVGRI